MLSTRIIVLEGLLLAIVAGCGSGSGGGIVPDAGSSQATDAADAPSSPMDGALVATVDAPASSDGGGDGGLVPTCGSAQRSDSPASCAGDGDGRNNCGPTNESCCTSLLVPCGTMYRTFQNGADGGIFSQSNPATVSDFRMDKYEITVGRFRAFINAGYGTAANPPAAGSGANPHLARSGWDSTWNASLVASGGLSAALKCSPAYATWTDAPGANENRPINCLTWYEAFAFCIWDGGRLPTEAEWEYAAAGGSDHRPYPWGKSSTASDAELAVFGCNYPANTVRCSGVANIAPVGSVPLGNGKFGQSDLAGNVTEWALDWFWPYEACDVDCAQLDHPAGRVWRGGAYDLDVLHLFSTNRNTSGPTIRSPEGGARCVRAP
jgi:sulfatase modifying factor 1